MEQDEASSADSGVMPVHHAEREPGGDGGIHGVTATGESIKGSLRGQWVHRGSVSVNGHGSGEVGSGGYDA